MKTKLFQWGLMLLTVFSFNACSEDDNDPKPKPEEPKLTGVYILNAGKIGNNNATLDFYNPETNVLEPNIFFNVNKRGLGDTGQSLLIYGSKIYIAVSGSNRIEITDLTGKSLKHIDPKDKNGVPQSPRYVASCQGKVYVTLFDGHVACIDTLSMNEENQIAVGKNPEQLVVSDTNKKLYVANSGGMNFPNYDKTVSIIDLNTFTISKTLEVGENPQYMGIDSQEDVYLISMGDYSPGSNILQRIEGKTDIVTKIDDLNASWMSMGSEDKLYIISTQYDANWNMTAEYYVYDAKNEKLAGKFITDGSSIPNPYHISVDKTTGNVYIGSSDYTNTGSMYVYSPKGKFIHKFDVSGINPEAAYFLTK